MVENEHDEAPGASVTRRVLRRAPGLLGYAVALVAAILLWPTSLGGCTTLTIVSGHSMEPTYYTGDLVVARCGEPAVGDVVVYQPADLGGARIIHRIVGGDAGGWVMQGDNNSWEDPFTPSGDEVLGVAQLHLPKVGLAAALMTSPLLWLSLLVIALAIFVWPGATDEDEDADDGALEDSGEPDDPGVGPQPVTVGAAP
ncbi:signal peptidase I [Cellulomonas sp. P5_C6]